MFKSRDAYQAHRYETVVLDRNERAPVGVTGQEAPGPVDWVHKPARAAAAMDAGFFSDEGVTWPQPGQLGPNGRLDQPVGFGDRAAVRLRLGSETMLGEVSHRDGVRGVGQPMAEGEVVRRHSPVGPFSVDAVAVSRHRATSAASLAASIP